MRFAIANLVLVALLTVALLSNLMAILLQALCARLGIGAGRDLAQACRDAFPRALSWPLWVLAEIAICATVSAWPSERCSRE